MLGNSNPTFNVDGESYQITPQVCRVLCHCLRRRQDVVWAEHTEPSVSYGIKIDGSETYSIQRTAQSLLSETQLGREVVSQMKTQRQSPRN